MGDLRLMPGVQPADGLRPALYHRFHRLLPFIAHPFVRRLGRLLLWSVGLVYFGFILLVLILRYSVLPNIEAHRSDIEALASRALGQQISIGRIEASWDGLHPDLALFDVRVNDAEGRPALAFAEVETVLSWWSVPAAELRLRLLRIDEPTLHLRRDAGGRIFIAGIPLDQDSKDDDGRLSGWILAQDRIRIRGATLVWEDEQRGAPPLVLEDLNFALDNAGRRHRFGLSAVPPPEFASRIDLRGDFRGQNLETLEAWKGQAYAEIDYADLAIWRQWIDYPISVAHGRGALRAWLGFAGGELRDLSTDIAMNDLALRLGEGLPVLELEHMAGRIEGRRGDKGFSVRGRGIELATAGRVAGAAAGVAAGETGAPILIPPTDFQVEWQPEANAAPSLWPFGARAGVPAGGQVNGKLSVSRVDLAALAGLAVSLPLDARSRRLLADFSPRGEISELRASWRGDTTALQNYSLKARFDQLALRAHAYFPGFTGLSGSLDASEAGGKVSLHAEKGSVALPRIFPETPILLDTLDVQAKWKLAAGVLEAELTRIDFSGPDASGSAKGSYRYTGEGPGSIDLTASASRADGRAVWRYMPHLVNAGARHWLRDALLAGTASDARLVLKGDLADFPFRDKRLGQFLVTTKAHDVTLDYGTGWPKITGIEGELRFEGAGMVVEASRGTILGAQLSRTRAEIPDFDAHVAQLKVKGLAEGPTSEFLRFIEQSPVGERIDHFTADMSAQGDGRLDIALHIPLDSDHLGESKVNGSYHFLNNELIVDQGLPPLRQVNGNLQFSEKDLRIPEANATLLGGPVKIKGGTLSDGRVVIGATGSVNIAQLRRQVDLPVFDSLSGTAGYRGEVRVKKRSADLVIDSNLVGITSSLPEPFNKSASEAMALRFEKSSLPAQTLRSGEIVVRDQLRASLGGNLSAQIIRRRQVSGFEVERGAIAVGRPLQLPERGLSVGVTARRLDADGWRKVLRTPAGNRESGGKGGTDGGSPAPLDTFNLKAGEMLLLGRSYSNVEVAANATASRWQIRLASREASGDLEWQAAGRGKLTARLRQLHLDPAKAAPGGPPEDAIEELPALDIVADDFAVGSRHFGRLEVQARNERNFWRLDRVAISNPQGSLKGTGQWQLGGAKRTQLDFQLEARDLGKLLDRLGYAGTVRGGTAQLEGKLAWAGTPVGLDYPTLNGELVVDAAKGQFLKVDPGAGKLIGLISLQALPRRIGLDFRDVFSEGFAFDSINGALKVQNGVMRTERLQIDGTAARILMRGEADIEKETQRLNVSIQPEVGSTAALGLALVNPVVGVASLLAHKILQNPLNQIFSFNYLITGTWDDPKVEKISRAAAASEQGAAEGGTE